MNSKLMKALAAAVFCGLSIGTSARAGVIYVNAGASAGGNGTTWADAHNSLSDAIERSSVGDQLWVAAGTYNSIELRSGIAIYGGFAGGETDVSQSKPDQNITTVNGGGQSRTVRGIGTDSSTLMQGFHVQNGFAAFPEAGGGLLLKNSDAQFVRCTFSGNRTTHAGGAVAILGGSPAFINCRFFGNDGGNAAGAVFSARGSTPRFVNCLFHDNQAAEGGAVAVSAGTVTFINCTLADNSATRTKGGALLDAGGHSVLRNCILWGNVSSVVGTEQVYNVRGATRTTTIEHTNIKGGWQGSGNIDADPLFVNAASDDFRLQAGSPCRDQGNNAALPTDTADLSGNGNRIETLPRDLALRSRVEGNTVDMGAFEYAP